MSVFDYIRRKSSVVNIGGVPLGGDNPIRLQSMTNTSTMDTPGSVAQIKRIAAEGADYVRLTAQGVREAENLALIRAELRKDGITVPLVADIHFNPNAAFAASKNSLYVSASANLRFLAWIFLANNFGTIVVCSFII